MSTEHKNATISPQYFEQINFWSIFWIYLQLSEGDDLQTRRMVARILPQALPHFDTAVTPFSFYKIVFGRICFWYFARVVHLSYFWPLAWSLPHFDTVTYFPIFGPKHFCLDYFSCRFWPSIIRPYLLLTLPLFDFVLHKFWALGLL